MQATEPFQLSALGLQRCIFLDENDFFFVVGDVEYKCSQLQACFFSDRVSRLVMGDRTVNRVFLSTKDTADNFRYVMRLMAGKSIKVTESNAAFLISVAQELENDELAKRVQTQLESGNLELSNVVERINIKRQLGLNCQMEIDFLATHFNDVDFETITNLGIDSLEAVVESKSLKLETEDQLFEIIRQAINTHGECYSVLLRHVQFQFLSNVNLNHFLELVFPDLIDTSLWSKICQCLCCFCDFKDKRSMLQPLRYAKLESNGWITSDKGPFLGIISHLRAKCGGNPHIQGIIDITASSNLSSKCHQLVDYHWNGYWSSNDSQNSFVQFDFKANRVILTGYSLKSDGNTSWHLISWAVEVSNDAQTWDIVDIRNTRALDGKYITKTFECSKQLMTMHRFVRIRQVGYNSGNSYNMKLSSIEFFGRLIENVENI